MAVADRIRFLPCRAAVAAVASMFFGVVLMLCCVVLDSAVCVTTCCMYRCMSPARCEYVSIAGCVRVCRDCDDVCIYLAAVSLVSAVY